MRREGLDASDFNLLFRCMARLMIEKSMIRAKRNATSGVFAKHTGAVEVTEMSNKE